MQRNRKKLALVCTIGGHFEQLTNLSEFYDGYDHFWITNRNKQTESQLRGQRKYFVDQGHFKKPWAYLRQIVPSAKAFARERPTHVLSTGSGRTALVPFLLARLLGVRFIYIDTFSRVNGYSKFGTFLVKVGHPIFSQWEDPGNEKVCYIGPIFKKVKGFAKNTGENFVFVTVGTRVEPFTCLLEAVDELAQKGTISEKVIVQAGHTRYTSDHIETFDFCKPDRIDELIMNARYVITQESAGIGTKCLKFSTPFIVMPRDFSRGELPALSDMKEDLQIRLAQMGYTTVVNNTDELKQAIAQIDRLKTGFAFDNTPAISALKSLMEERA